MAAHYLCYMRHDHKVTLNTTDPSSGWSSVQHHLPVHLWTGLRTAQKALPLCLDLCRGILGTLKWVLLLSPVLCYICAISYSWRIVSVASQTPWRHMTPDLLLSPDPSVVKLKTAAPGSQRSPREIEKVCQLQGHIIVLDAGASLLLFLTQ